MATEPLLAELDVMLELAKSGSIFETKKFRDTPPDVRRLNDIAFSGDGEPTTYTNFDEIIDLCAQRKRRHGLHDVKMILITNASMFHRPQVQQGLKLLDANQGEIWAKLEAGTESYFKLVDRTSIPFQRILGNITLAAQQRSLVIQALFMRVHGDPPTPGELRAFCDRLNEIRQAGGHLKLIQVYTIARRPAETFVAPLEKMEVDQIVQLVRQKTGIPAEPYYGK